MHYFFWKVDLHFFKIDEVGVELDGAVTALSRYADHTFRSFQLKFSVLIGGAWSMVAYHMGLRVGGQSNRDL